MREPAFVYEVVVAACQQGTSGRCADAGGVKIRIAKPVIGQGVEGGRADDAPKALVAPKPTSSSSTQMTLGAPCGAWGGVAHHSLESLSVLPTTPW